MPAPSRSNRVPVPGRARGRHSVVGHALDLEQAPIPVGFRRTIIGQRAIAYTRHICRLLSLAAAIGLLLVPVELQVGAESPHPHAGIQLWIETANGTSHHDDDNHGDDHEYGFSIAETAGQSLAGVTKELPVSVAAAPDVPRLSRMTVPVERGTALFTRPPVTHWLVAAESRHEIGEPIAPRGRLLPGPEPPPP